MKILADLEPNDCRYPMNEGGPYLFCADPQEVGSSYCPFHHVICLRPDHGLQGRENDRAAAMVRKNRVPTVVLLMDGAEA